MNWMKMNCFDYVNTKTFSFQFLAPFRNFGEFFAEMYKPEQNLLSFLHFELVTFFTERC